MARLSADKAAKIGDVLFRYMRARHRFRERVEHPLPAHELAALIGHGKVEFDEVYIEPDAKPPIVFDGKEPIGVAAAGGGSGAARHINATQCHRSSS